MNNLIISNSVRFISLVLLQVLVLNNINLFGHINPIVYISFVFLFPFSKNLTSILFFSFSIGLSIDFFLDSGGINAASCLFIAYVRLPILKIILSKSDIEYQQFKIRDLSFIKMLIFVFVLTIIHHFIVFSLEYFSFNHFISILSKTIKTSLFSVFIIVSGIILLTKESK